MQVGNDAYDPGQLLNPIGGLVQSMLFGDDVFGSNSDTGRADLAPAVEVLAGGLKGLDVFAASWDCLGLQQSAPCSPVPTSQPR